MIFIGWLCLLQDDINYKIFIILVLFFYYIEGSVRNVKIISFTLQLKEYDYDLYEQRLEKNGWVKMPDQRVYRKMFGEMETEVREHLPAFSGEVTLRVSAKNPKGISKEQIDQIIDALYSADLTADKEKDE
jgi:hypothetical protein